jgi:hypothetical protein
VRVDLRTERHRAKVEAGRIWRLGVTFFALLAFALQSYTTQTHIHKPALPGWAGIATALDLDVPAKNGKMPAKQDRQNCPLCQGMAHAGAFVSPAAAAALAPTLSVQIIAAVLDAALSFNTLSHDWQSRGPPA